MSLSVEYELITSADRLEALRGAWDGLWDRDPRATPFQTADWQLAWWRHLGAGQLCVVAAWSDGRLIGLAPLMREEGGRLCFLGTDVSDYLDVLCEPASREEATAGVLQLALTVGGGMAELLELREDSPVLTVPVPPGHERAVSACSVCPVVLLPALEEELPRALPPRMVENLRFYGRRLARSGGTRFEVADVSSLPDLLESLFRLHAARWGARNKLGVLASAAIQAFHRAVAPGLLAKGLLRLHALRLDGQVICVLYVLVSRGRAYYYLGGFDPAQRLLSPSTLTIVRAMEDAIRLGAREFDFLRGDERYKYAWGATDRPLHQCLLSAA